MSLLTFDYSTIIVMLGTGLLGLASGLIGSFAVLRRRALIGDALAHAALPGICIAFLLTGQRSFAILLAGAFASGLLGVCVISFLRRQTRTKEDALIGIVLSVFFGVGIVLSRIIQNLGSEGSKAGLDNFIFGKTAGMLAQDVYVTLCLVAVILMVLVLLGKEFKILSFDQEFAAVQGWPVLFLDLVLMGLLALTVVVGLPAVGVVLMAALLIIPGAAARFWTERLGPMLAISGGIGLLTGVLGTFLGLVFSDLFGLDLPAGPVIILTGTSMFLISMLLAPGRGVLARTAEHFRLARKVAEQNLLRTAYELGEPLLPARGEVKVEELIRRRAWTESRARRLLERARSRGLFRKIELEGRAGPESYQLTDRGLEHAVAVVRSHRLWELFLIQEAQIAPDHIERDADAIEHHLSPSLLKRLEDELRATNRLPEADRLPPSPHSLEAPRP